MNILGLEVRDWCCHWIDNYTKNENINNCRVLRYCVANGLQFLENESINEVYYLFPDPWVKTKHLRRRAFNQNFLNKLESWGLNKNHGIIIKEEIAKEIYNYEIS